MSEAITSVDPSLIVLEHVRMCPRAIFDYKRVDQGSGRYRPVVRDIAMLEKPGVYVLYRDDLPYYIGQAKCLRGRLYNHSRRPGSKHDLFWNYFSAFVVEDERHRDQVEALLISAFPTANGAKPKLKGPHTSDRVRDVLVMDRSKVLLRGYKRRVNL